MIWGSFLNVLSYRLIKGVSIITPRSFCPHCKKSITWYDNIPIVSWIILRGKCRNCKAPISALYIFVEFLTALLLTTLYYQIPHNYFFPYFIFVSALIVTIRTDLEHMLISRYVTLFLVPLGFALSGFGLLPITIQESIVGALGGYLLLFVIAKLFYKLTGKYGMGQGDLDLLAFIGSFLGFFGCWISMLVGSVIGSFIGLIYTIIARQNYSVKIPFGPFLSLGAISYLLFKPYFLQLLIIQ